MDAYALFLARAHDYSMQHLVHKSPGVLCRAKQLFRAAETVSATAPVWFPSEMQTKHEARKDGQSEAGGAYTHE